MRKNKLKIVGITGPFGSGKSTAASFFVSKGYTKITLSSFLEEEAKKRSIRKITRRILQDIGNEWREKYGKGVLAKKALSLAEKKGFKRVVVDGIRNPGEINVFQKEDFILLAILVDRNKRLQRLIKLNRREKLNKTVFMELDRRDLGFGQSEDGLRLYQCIALADIFVVNNGMKEDFLNLLEEKKWEKI